MKNEFISKVQPIRSKNLRNFLKTYFYIYVQENKENNPMFPKWLTEHIQKRAPKIWPGLRAIQNFLHCSKGAAQDYLRAIHIAHEIFVAHEIKSRKKKLLVPIKRREYEKLKGDVAREFNQAVKALAFRKPRTIAINTRNSLRVVATLIRNSTGAFTPEDCAKIVREIASHFV